MAVIDVQVHAYDKNHPGRPWIKRMSGPEHVTGREMVAAMDSVKVDGAILVSTYTLYGFDPSYAVECYKENPGKFGLVAPIDSNDPSSAETIAEWAKTEGAVGIRLVMMQAATRDAEDPGLSRALKAAAKHNLPVNLLIWDRLEQADALMARYPDNVLVIDHLGLVQSTPPPAEPWKELPKILAMARHPNVRIKVSGACTMSHEAYPFNDIWDPVAQIVDAYGVDRCMWGTDWTRAVRLTYAQAVDAFRDSTRWSASDKAALMGGTVQRVYGWSPS